MSTPNSFCFISTFNSCHELIGMLFSLSLYHPNINVYGFVDLMTLNELNNMIPKIKLNLILNECLNKYSNKNRQNMVIEGIWDEFQMQKAEVIKYALNNEDDTMFLDSDIIIFKSINIIDKTKEIGVSPHFTKKSNTDEVGYYNGGCLWTRHKSVPDDWIEFTKTSRYHDQASIEDLVKKYSFQEFGEEINYMPWRIIVGENIDLEIKKISINDEDICINSKPLIFLHTHFTDNRFSQINNIFINALIKLKKYRELLIIDRIKSKKWYLYIPKQPRVGIWNHKNDSFRELALLLKKNNHDVDISLVDNNYCLLGNHTILYDRPTSEWFSKDILNYANILMGNCDVNIEGDQLSNYLNVSPWIFWPRRPFFYENYINNVPRKLYNERSVNSIFIGNIENSVQNNFRKSYSWNRVIEVYHCTHGKQHKFTQEEYLSMLSNSKYGLCLRGYGSKCHREVELMGLGTVPIITSEVNITSYMDPPIPYVHYIKIDHADELVNKLNKISPEEWEKMSKNCREWYLKNIHSKNCMSTFLDYFFYN